MGNAIRYVRRYIDSYTYDEKQESYHPRDTFIESADTELYNAAISCDWVGCSHMCSNVSLLLAVVSLKKSQPERALVILNEALLRTDMTLKQKSRLQIFKAFTFEVLDILNDEVYDLYLDAEANYPDHHWPYFGIIRYRVFPESTEDEKKRIYYDSYGTWQMHEALVDGLLAKEFYPENLEDHAILPYDAPSVFWFPENEKQYFLIRQLMSPFIQSVNAKLVARLIDGNILEFKDPQAIRYLSYQERFARFFQFSILNLIRRLIGRPVLGSYVYFGGYVPGSELTPHTDRPACEYTMSLCVDHYPPGATWRLGIDKRSRQGLGPFDEGIDGEIPEDPENIVYADLQPGDAFIFQGRHKTHWRDGPLPEGQYSRVYFFHFVNEDFTGSLS